VVSAGRKQHRHLYVKPRDPRTPLQLYWRACFGAASKKYSAALTDEQQDACTAAGAKLPCRKRLGESGRLTGQQWLIRREYAAHQQSSARSAEKAQKSLQTQGISVSTWDTHRHISGITPGPHRRATGRTSKNEDKTEKEECRRHKEQCGVEVRQNQRLTRSFPVFGRASVLASPSILRHQASRGSRGRSPSQRRRRGRGLKAGTNNKSCANLVIEPLPASADDSTGRSITNVSLTPATRNVGRERSRDWALLNHQ